MNQHLAPLKGSTGYTAYLCTAHPLTLFLHSCVLATTMNLIIAIETLIKGQGSSHSSSKMSDSLQGSPCDSYITHM